MFYVFNIIIFFSFKKKYFFVKKMSLIIHCVLGLILITNPHVLYNRINITKLNFKVTEHSSVNSDTRVGMGRSLNLKFVI